MTWQLCSPRLVGRHREFTILARLLADVTETSSGRLALVTGEAGIGKSRLVSEVAARARRSGCLVLVGHSVPGGDPYRPLAEALAGGLRGRPIPTDPALRAYLPALGNLLPELSADQPARGGRIVLGEAVLRLMAALSGSAGTVLVLEDVHWADPDTLDIVTYLSHAAEATPLVLLLTARDDQNTPPQLLDLVSSCAAPVLFLPRLGPPALREVLESCLGAPPPENLVDFIVDHADGVPFLVEELLSGLASVGALNSDGQLIGPLTPNVPRTFAATVRRRLEDLDPPARRVVEAAAVLGRRFNWRVLPAMTAVPEADVLASLRTVVANGLAESSGADTFRFRHNLTRDAVRAQLLPPDLAALAKCGALAVERVEPEACELTAELWAAAGDSARAAQLYLRAGRRAHRRAALHTACLLLSRATELPDAPAAVRRQAELALLEVLAAVGDADRALALGESLLAAGESSVRLTLAEVAVEAGRSATAAEQLAAVAAESPRGSVLAARIALDSGDPAAAQAGAEKALLGASEAEMWPVACEALQVIGRAERLTDLAAARRAFAEAEALALAHGLPVERISALHELGTVDLLVGGDIELLLRTRELAAAAGLLALTATVDVQIAAALLHRDPEEAMFYAERSSRMAHGLRMDLLRATALFFCATVYASRGDLEAMERTIADALALAPDDLDVNAGIWGAARAHVALLADDLPTLATCLDTAVEYLRRSASTTPAPTRGLWALVRTVLDRDGAAARLEAQPSTVNWENRALLGYAEAVAAGRSGDPARAEAAFAAADATMAMLPWWQHRIRLLIAPDAITAGWGDPIPWTHEAWEVFRARGEKALVARCRAVFAQAQAPIPRRGPGATPVPATLTAYRISPREMEVLTLAAQGRSDAAIADYLVISQRTVESHVASLRRKTGATSRAALIEVLRSGDSDP